MVSILNYLLYSKKFIPKKYTQDDFESLISKNVIMYIKDPFNNEKWLYGRFDYKLTVEIINIMIPIQ